jgi:hypothetical protein
LLAITIDEGDDAQIVVVAGLPLDDSAPGRPIAHIAPRPDSQVAVAP